MDVSAAGDPFYFFHLGGNFFALTSARGIGNSQYGAGVRFSITVNRDVTGSRIPIRQTITLAMYLQDADQEATANSDGNDTGAGEYAQGATGASGIQQAFCAEHGCSVNAGDVITQDSCRGCYQIAGNPPNATPAQRAQEEASAPYVIGGMAFVGSASSSSSSRGLLRRYASSFSSQNSSIPKPIQFRKLRQYALHRLDP